MMRTWDRGVNVEVLGQGGISPGTVRTLEADEKVDAALDRGIDASGRDFDGFRFLEGLSCQSQQSRNDEGADHGVMTTCPGSRPERTSTSSPETRPRLTEWDPVFPSASFTVTDQPVRVGRRAAVGMASALGFS